LLLKDDQRRFQTENQKFLERIEIYLPFLKDYHFTIDTQNTFPHSSGIASSASGMAALAMNFMSLENLNPEMTEAYFYQKHLYSVWVQVLAEV
jgi:diphosphomevalonate decarboxylase